MTGTITWSEWQGALAYQAQLTNKNLLNVFNYLDLKNKGEISFRTLEQAYKPHMFRLRLKQGTEEYALKKLLSEVGMLSKSSPFSKV